jgi:amidase
MRDNRVDALVAPTLGPAWVTDIVNGDHFVGGGSSSLPAVAGYPHVTVPMGVAAGLPVGISFIGEAWSEAKLLSFAYAYEQRAHARTPPRYTRHLEEDEPFSAALRPASAPR